MFKIENDTLYVTLPEGMTAKEIVEEANNQFKRIENQLHGLDLKVNGRITTGLSMFLGHKLAHITKSVSMYDPKEAKYYKVIWH